MKVLFLQPPSPPRMNVKRDYAGGMGVADPSVRPGYGHDAGYITLPYMSLLYAAAVAERDGMEAAFIDAQAENLNEDAVAARVAAGKPDVLVSVINLPSIYADLELLKTVRARVPGVRIVAIGAVVAPLFDTVAGSGAVDAVVRGDPEVVLIDMARILQGSKPFDAERFEITPSMSDVKRSMFDVPGGGSAQLRPPGVETAGAYSWRGSPGQAVLEEGGGSLEAAHMEGETAASRTDDSSTDLQISSLIPHPSSSLIPHPFPRGVLANREPARVHDLDALPDLPYHLVPLERYHYHGFGKGARFAAIFASRGCSFRCYYCPYPVGFGDKIVARDPGRVAGEIERLRRNHGVTGILFRDQVFTMNWERTTALCDEIIRRKLDIQWVVETRLDRVNMELLRKMKQAGCARIHYGLESGDPEIFSRVGKDGAEGRLERLVENFRLTEEAGIHPHMFVLIGLLGESRETIEHTIALVRRMKPLTLQVSIVTPYPGTPLFEHVKEKGLLATEDWSQYTGFNAVARTEALSTDDLLRLRERIIREHAKAVSWKKRARLVRLAFRYARDGSLLSRIRGKICRGRFFPTNYTNGHE